MAKKLPADPARISPQSGDHEEFRLVALKAKANFALKPRAIGVAKHHRQLEGSVRN
jgi:hypothetical protein